MPRPHPIIAFALVCVTRSLAGQAPVERDSAGIRIIENPSRAAAPVVFRLGAQALDLGGAANNPDDEFHTGGGGRASYMSGLRLSDGTLAVPDRVRIQFFDARGARSGMVGRYGSGPSEFRALWPAAVCRTRGDTLVADDPQNGRLAVVHGQRVVRTTPYMHGGLAGCLDDGTVLMAQFWPGRSEPTYKYQLNRVRLDGTPVNAFDDLVFRTPSAVAHNVFGIVRSWGQRVYAGDGATSEVRVYRADGRLTHIIRSADPPKPITAADVERGLRGSPPAARDQWRPDTYPAYPNFIVDAGGRLWVKDFPLTQPIDHEGWTAFDVNGRLIGRLDVPRRIGKGIADVAAFGVDDLLMWRVDDDGFSHLTIFPILKVQR
jgi:hypothetical protein